MSALSWMKRRAMEREIEKLREKIEARRLVVDAQPSASLGTWFSGAGLSLASGFMAGLALGVPSPCDRESILRLLMRASAAAIAAAAVFVETHPPDAVPSGPAGAIVPETTAPADQASGNEGDRQVTRADLLQRLRRQSAGGGRAGSSA